MRPPTVSEVIREKQEQQKRNFKGTRNVNFESGQKVMIRNYKNPNNPSWSQATVKQKIGPRTYTCVYTHNNKEINRHIDQIRDQTIQTDEVNNQSVDTDDSVYQEANDSVANENNVTVDQNNATDNSVIIISDDSIVNETQTPPGVSRNSRANDPDWTPNTSHLNSESNSDEETPEIQDDYEEGRELRPRKNGKAIKPSK